LQDQGVGPQQLALLGKDIAGQRAGGEGIAGGSGYLQPHILWQLREIRAVHLAFPALGIQVADLDGMASGFELGHGHVAQRGAERGSLSAVARELGVGQSTITRHLRELEGALGVALLSRNTRGVSLTEEGARYYADCLQILQMVERAIDGVGAGATPLLETFGFPAPLRWACCTSAGCYSSSRISIRRSKSTLG